jgi:hypothetical protein
MGLCKKKQKIRRENAIFIEAQRNALKKAIKNHFHNPGVFCNTCNKLLRDRYYTFYCVFILYIAPYMVSLQNNG